MRRINAPPQRLPGHAMLLLSLVMLAAAPQSLRAQSDDGDLNGARFSAEAASIFNKRCSACHTFGKGIKVGPDLKGVNQRRKHEWLLKFIHESSSVIKSGDPIATALFAEFRQQRMPDWTDLSEKQIGDILDYLAVDGPNIKPADERNAELATPAEIETGSYLFYGQTSFKYGAKACASCHRVEESGVRGGTLGPELTTAYFKYQDKSLTSFLRHPCFRWDPAGAATNYLTARESFALKAFLRRAAVDHATSAANAAQGSGSR